MAMPKKILASWRVVIEGMRFSASRGDEFGCSDYWRSAQLGFQVEEVIIIVAGGSRNVNFGFKRHRKVTEGRTAF